MKILTSLIMLALLSFGVSASAISLGDIVNGIQVVHDIRNGNDSDHHNYSRPPRPGHGTQVTCSARDKGWEEHGSHRTCRECLRHHGKCIERCAINYTACRAEGFDRNGFRATFEGRAQSRYDAERQAVYSCQRDYRFRGCRVVSCSSGSETVSSRSCR